MLHIADKAAFNNSPNFLQKFSDAPLLSFRSHSVSQKKRAESC